MKSDVQPSDSLCSHQHASGCGSRLALISLSEEAGQGTVPQSACNRLGAGTLKEICRIDLGSRRDLIIDSLKGHKAAVVVQDSHNGGVPGTMSLMDIGSLLHKGQEGRLRHKGCELLMSELEKVDANTTLPKSIILFNVETGKGEESRLTIDKNSGLSANLAVVVAAVLDTMRRNS